MASTLTCRRLMSLKQFECVCASACLCYQIIIVAPSFNYTFRVRRTPCCGVDCRYYTTASIVPDLLMTQFMSFSFTKFSQFYQLNMTSSGDRRGSGRRRVGSTYSTSGAHGTGSDSGYCSGLPTRKFSSDMFAYINES